MPRPGEVSLAHNGVLFLDEFPEFPRDVLEMLRQPLEDGCVNIARSNMTLCFPSIFMLVAAMNPCPCGFYGDSTRECRCTPAIIQRYLGKISGPLLDRIDIHVEVPAVPYKELRGPSASESSAEIRARVERARAVQQARGFYNSRMPARMIRKLCALDDAGERTLEMAVRRMGLSARAHDRILKVARTVADLGVADGLRQAPRRSRAVPQPGPQLLELRGAHAALFAHDRAVGIPSLRVTADHRQDHPAVVRRNVGRLEHLHAVLPGGAAARLSLCPLAAPQVRRAAPGRHPQPGAGRQPGTCCRSCPTPPGRARWSRTPRCASWRCSR